MAVTLTPNYNFQKPAKGDAGWWANLNANFDAIDAALEGIQSQITNLVHTEILHVNTNSATPPIENVQGFWIKWNPPGSSGSTDFINHRGLGTGGFLFDTTVDAVTFVRLAEMNQTFSELQSSLLLRTIVGGVVGMRRVSLGAANSGGAGARMLTVSN